VIRLALLLLLIACPAQSALVVGERIDVQDFEHDYDEDGNTVEHIVGGIITNTGGPTPLSIVGANPVLNICASGSVQERHHCTLGDDSFCNGGDCLELDQDNSRYLRVTANSSDKGFEKRYTNFPAGEDSSMLRFMMHAQIVPAQVATLELFEIVLGKDPAQAVGVTSSLRGRLHSEPGLFGNVATLEIFASVNGSVGSLFRCGGSENNGALCDPCDFDSDCSGGARCVNPGPFGACDNVCLSVQLDEQRCDTLPAYEESIVVTLDTFARSSEGSSKYDLRARPPFEN